MEVSGEGDDDETKRLPFNTLLEGLLHMERKSENLTIAAAQLKTEDPDRELSGMIVSQHIAVLLAMASTLIMDAHDQKKGRPVRFLCLTQLILIAMC
jgi:hypothetical protein